MNIADLINPETGKTYREENLAKSHKIPLGALVEIVDTGARLFVVKHTRDCDGTPLYSLCADPDDMIVIRPGFGKPHWHNGYSEDALRTIKVNAAKVEEEG